MKIIKNKYKIYDELKYSKIYELKYSKNDIMFININIFFIKKLNTIL